MKEFKAIALLILLGIGILALIKLDAIKDDSEAILKILHQSSGVITDSIEGK